MDNPIIPSNDVWTRVSDDTGGGNSLTNFPLLYFHGDAETAEHAIDSAFDVHIKDATPEYGKVLSLRTASSFAELSWFERGMGYDSVTRCSVHPTLLDQRTRPYFSEQHWLSLCTHNLNQAIDHSQCSQASSKGKMFFCARPELLYLAMTSSSVPRNDPRVCAWALELLTMVRLKPVPGSNHARLAAGLGLILKRVAFLNMSRALGKPTISKSWEAFTHQLRVSDFALIRSLGPSPHDLSLVDWAQLCFAAYPETRHPSSEPLHLDHLEPHDILRLRLLLSPDPSHNPFSVEAEAHAAMLPRSYACLERADILHASGGARLVRTSLRL